ncbi:MAG: ABC transporter substrate-binding protein [Actinomycetes bacterium]
MARRPDDRRRPTTVRAATRVAAVLLLGATGALLAGCSEKAPSATAGSSSTVPGQGGVTPSEGDGATVLSMFEGEQWFDGDVPAPTNADPAKEPVKVGFVSVDAGPIGAMPELHTSTDAAVDFMNAELGGVGGRPVQLVPCILSNPMSPDEAQACGRKLVAEDVVAVLGGIGLSQGPLLQVLADNDVPYVGGLPVNEAEMSSTDSFQFSGGGPGAFVAFADQAVRKDGADRIAVLYADYPSIRQAAVDYGASMARELGAQQVTEIPFPMGSQDYSAVVQKAVEADPQAIFVGAADMACAPILQALADLQSTAEVYMVGSCADRKFLDQVGLAKVAGTRFNVENRIALDQVPEADFPVYLEAMTRYGRGTNALGAATVSFRDAMNLWAVMDEVGPDVTGTAIRSALRAARDRPSFAGHPYTCDGRQVPAMPALCAAQQVIAEIKADGSFSEASDGWIDVPKVLAEHPVAVPAKN